MEKIKKNRILFVLALVLMVVSGCATMPTFSDNPDLERLKEAIKTVDDFFNHINGIQGDEIIAVEFENLEFVLWGSEKVRDAEYRRRHGRWTKIPGYSWAWLGGNKVEVWAPFKRLSNGNVIIHPWPLQHETHHALDETLRLRGRSEDMSNPDEMVKSDFWEKQNE
jgi:hypothetical protein